MIVFSRVKWMNLLSTGNAWTEIDLKRDASTLIIGENGAGKSTILDALCYALYGKPFRKIKKDQLINSVNKRDALVEVEFTIYGKEYRVCRGMKPNKFEIWEDGKLYDQNAGSRDYQAMLEQNILRLSYKSFTQIVILGSSSFVPFMQLASSTRREVIEDLLDIRIFSNMNALNKERMTNNREDLKLNDRDMTSVEEIIQVQEDHAARELKRKTESIDTLNERITELETNVLGVDNDIAVALAEVDGLLGQITDSDVVDAKVQKMEGLYDKLVGKKQATCKHVAFFKDNLSCPTCKQEITADTRDKKVTEYQGTVDEIEAAVGALNMELDKVYGRQKQVLEIQRKIYAVQKNVSNQLEPLKRGDERELLLLRRQIADLQKEHEESFSASNLEELRARKDAIQEDRKGLLESKTRYEIASIILRDTGIKSRIIKQYIPIINTLVNKYLASMDFFVKFELNEQFEEKILSRHRDDFTYDSFSEGEKMRIDLALLFTWRSIARMKNSANTNLLILDEVFDASLDANGCEEFLQLIHNMEDANVFVISHKGDILQDKFISTIKFEKRKNFSMVSE